MDLEITKSHSRGAERGSYTNCPTVRALKAAGFKDVSVNETVAHIGDEDFKLPKTLVEAIRSYDYGSAFKYGTYRIAGLKSPKKAK